MGTQVNVMAKYTYGRLGTVRYLVLGYQRTFNRQGSLQDEPQLFYINLYKMYTIGPRTTRSYYRS